MDTLERDMAELRGRVFTSRYSNPALKTRGELLAVGITLGTPKWSLGYPCVRLPMLAPQPAIFGIEDRERFAALFIESLEQKRGGVVQVLAELRKLLAQAPEGGALALLCFEDVRKPEMWCHRQMLARWLAKCAGLEVPELPDPSTPKR